MTNFNLLPCNISWLIYADYLEEQGNFTCYAYRYGFYCIEDNNDSGCEGSYSFGGSAESYGGGSGCGSGCRDGSSYGIGDGNGSGSGDNSGYGSGLGSGCGGFGNNAGDR